MGASSYLVRTIKQRLESNRKITKEGHWLWMGALDSVGYGHIKVDDRVEKVHRIAYRFYKEVSLPNNVKVLHKNSCNTRNCFNPEHLYLGTQKENVQDILDIGHNKNKNKTQCKYGHIYTEESTYFYRGGRHCKICKYNYKKYGTYELGMQFLTEDEKQSLTKEEKERYLQ